MNKKIGLSDVKIEWLNKRALVLISIFSRAAHKMESQVIDIYNRIKREIKVSLSEENIS
jgi:hypothetical protein